MRPYMDLNTCLRIAASTAFGKENSIKAWIIQQLEKRASQKETVIKSLMFGMLKVRHNERKNCTLNHSKSLEKAGLR